MYRPNNENSSSAVWQIALYLRLSREDGNDESLSITNQRAILMEYIEENFGEPYAIVDEYIDDGETGTDIARPEFKRMINDVEAGKVNCIIVKDLKRFMRNHGYQALYLEQIFPKNDTRFITVSEPRLDTYRNPNAVYGFDVPMHGIMNDRFAQGTSEAIKRTFANKVKQGKFIGAFCPYGYTKDPNDKNKLIIDEEAAQVVRDIFKWCLEGMSKRAICKQLKAYGIPNPTAYKRSKGLNYSNPHAYANDGMWNPTTLIRLLKNEAYIGTMVQGKEKVVSYKIHDKVRLPEEKWVRVPDALPAIISVEQFEKVQSLISQNTRVTKQSTTLTLLAGFLKCFDCRKSMRRKFGGNMRTVYYVCRSHNEKGVCSPHSVRSDALEDAVFRAVKTQITLVANLRNRIAQLHEKPLMNAQPSRLKTMIETKKKDLERVSAINDDLYLDWKNGIIEKSSFERLKAKTDNQIKQLNESIANMEEELKVCSDNSTTHPLFEAFAQYSNIQELDREVLAALVDVIYIHENKEITIVFKYNDSIRSISEYIMDQQSQLQKLA